jgi:hypothetical protein
MGLRKWPVRLMRAAGELSLQPLRYDLIDISLSGHILHLGYFLDSSDIYGDDCF